jgi:hypothetical protein
MLPLVPSTSSIVEIALSSQQQITVTLNMYKRQCTANVSECHTPSDIDTIRPSGTATRAALMTDTNTSVMTSKGPTNRTEHLKRRQGVLNFTRMTTNPELETMYQKVCVSTSQSQELPTGTDTILGLSGYDIAGNPKRSQVVVDSERPSQDSQPGHDHYNSHRSNHGDPSSAAGSYQRLAVEAPHSDLPSHHSYTGAQPAHDMGSKQSVPSIAVNGGRGNDPLDRNGNPQSREFVYPGHSPEASGRNLLCADHPNTSNAGPYGTDSTHYPAPRVHQSSNLTSSMSERDTRSLAQEPWN